MYRNHTPQDRETLLPLRDRHVTELLTLPEEYLVGLVRMPGVAGEGGAGPDTLVCDDTLATGGVGFFMVHEVRGEGLF